MKTLFKPNWKTHTRSPDSLQTLTLSYRRRWSLVERRARGVSLRGRTGGVGQRRGRQTEWRASGSAVGGLADWLAGWLERGGRGDSRSQDKPPQPSITAVALAQPGFPSAPLLHECSLASPPWTFQLDDFMNALLLAPLDNLRCLPARPRI